MQQACPGLVGQIENGVAADVVGRSIAGHVARLIEKLDGEAPDSVILGCTHYPLVAEAFKAALPEGVRLQSQPDLVAESLAGYLARHPEFDAPPAPGPRVRFLTTGDAAAVGALASRFFGDTVAFEPL